MDILNLISFPAFTFTFFVTLGQLARRSRGHGVLGTILAVMLLLVVASATATYQVFILILGLVALIIGRAFPVSDAVLRGSYVTAVGAVLLAIFADLLRDSGVVRFGIPSLSHMFDPQLVFFTLVEGPSEAATVSVAAIVFYLICRGLTRAVARWRQQESAFWAFVVAVALTYIIEPKISLRSEYAYWIHNPFVVVAIIGSLLTGFVAGQRNNLPIFRPLSPESPVLSLLVYFFTYHLLLYLHERTSFPFSINYGWMAVHSFAVTLPLGVMIGKWSRENSAVVPSGP
jgi:hypothetical protein